MDEKCDDISQNKDVIVLSVQVPVCFVDRFYHWHRCIYIETGKHLVVIFNVVPYCTSISLRERHSMFVLHLTSLAVSFALLILDVHTDSSLHSYSIVFE